MAPLGQEGDLGRSRPRFHFTPVSNWINDPNGLIYHQGEYHLFYQHHPYGMVWGPMHWGHAVSTDLIHWTHLPIALYPDHNGTIFSGSIVLDVHNTSGLVPGGGLVAIFSFDTQAQGIAYSFDCGRTWRKYAINPVIPSPKRDLRDPKVFWYAPRSVWVMLLVAGDKMLIYHSIDLIQWTHVSTFGAPYGSRAGVWECPDLFPLEIDGQTKWVLLISVGDGAIAGGSGTQYFVGRFDGTHFVSDNPPDTILWLDYGTDNYAGMTYNNAPNSRRIFIAWMSNWRYARVTPTQGWRGSMTIPRDLRLIELPGHGIRLAQAPVAEIDSARTQIASKHDIVLHSSSTRLIQTDSRALDIVIDFEATHAEEYGLRLHTGGATYTTIGFRTAADEAFIDRRSSGNTAFHESFGSILSGPLLKVSGTNRLRVVLDSESVEVFVNDGLTVLTAQIFPPDGGDIIEVYSISGRVVVSRVDIFAL